MVFRPSNEPGNVEGLAAWAMLAEGPRVDLSAQEWQIAQLAASGLSNREIGHQLYLSHRTVASHLYRIFPKLGITSRNHLHAYIKAHEGT